MRSLSASICSKGMDALASPVSKLSHVASRREVASSMENGQEESLSLVFLTRARDAAGVEQTFVLVEVASFVLSSVLVVSASSRLDEMPSVA